MTLFQITFIHKAGKPVTEHISSKDVTHVAHPIRKS